MLRAGPVLQRRTPGEQSGRRRTGQTWHHVSRDLDRLHAVTFTDPTGTFRQRTDPTKPQIDLYARLDLPATAY